MDGPSASRSAFRGTGIQNSGEGDFTARDIYIGSTVNRKAYDELVADLRVTDPRDDKKRIQETKGGLLTDSYHWILDNSDFLQWRDDPQSRLLWIRGDPGKGKTMLLCGIINELEEAAPQLARPLPAYFFCQATDERLNTATTILRGLLYVLVCQHPPLVSYLQEKYKDAGRRLFEDANAWTALSEILRQMLSDRALEGKVLIIDALDECLRDRSLLLDFIARISPVSHVKWVVSSRNWPDIEERLDMADRKVTLRLELNENSISAAVDAYIRIKVDRLVELKKYDDATQASVRKHFTDKANNTFLWVALVYQELAKASARPWHTLKALEALPSSLDALYERMMGSITSSDDAELCTQILAVASVVYRPVSLKELVAVAKLPDYFDDRPRDLNQLIESCGSFLTVREERIYFVHQSAKDYLLQTASSQVLPAGIAHQHRAIFSRSIEAMSRILRRDIYSLVAPGFSIDDVPQQEPDPLALVRYSCVHWVYHLEDAEPVDKHTREHLQDGGLVHTFLQRKYLYWLEALSLQRSMLQAVLAVQKLQALVAAVGAQQLAGLVRDARRFVLSYKTAIEFAPLQLYASALLFSPARSLVRDLFKTDAPSWVMSPSLMELDWNACMHTLEGHNNPVIAVAFSPDGQWLISGSNDATIQIWDVATGARPRMHEVYHGTVTSVAFSPNCQWLALGYYKTIKVIGTGAQTLEGHSNSVTVIAFSPDSQWLASGSDDRTIKVWDVATGACVQTLEGHNKPAIAVAFSPDSQRLASGSDDRTIKVWDVATGMCVQTLGGHSNSVTVVAFSPDSRQRLASGSDDKTIKFWDVATGACVQTLEGHSGTVTSVAFSPDSQQLASGSYDSTAKVWDVATGACVQTLEGHSGIVTSVAFSPDSQRLASGSDDSNIKVWGVAIGAYIQTLEGHSDPVTSVAFSPDSQQLASGSHDETVKVWDVATGACVQTLEGHSDWVTSVVFSPDSQQLASGSHDKTVKVWDVATGACVQTLEGHSHWVTSVVFSPDNSQRLASGSYDKTVKVWDVATGACVQTLIIGTSEFKLTFSSIADSELSIDSGILKLNPCVTDAKLQEASTLLSPHYGLGISHDGVWITKDGQRVLWLPAEYRSAQGAFAVAGLHIGYGCHSGRVVIFCFR